MTVSPDSSRAPAAACAGNVKAETTGRSEEPAGPARLGIFAWFGLPVPFQDRVKMIRDAGFEATSVWWEEDNEARRRLRHLAPDLVRKAGLHLDNIHVPFTRCNALWSENDDARMATVRQHRGWVEDCARHGVGTLVMHVCTGRANVRHPDQGSDSMRRIVENAEARGVTIAIENTRDPDAIAWLLRSIESPSLGLCYDVSHDWLYSGEPAALLRDWGPRLCTTHFSDTDGRRDYHWLPGEGAVDFGRIADGHAWEDYAGTFLLEVVPKERDEDARSFLARAYESATAMRSRLTS